MFQPGSGNYHFDYDSWNFIRGLGDDRLYTDPTETLGIDFRCDPRRISPRVRDYYFKFRHFDMKVETDWPAARTFSAAADWVRRNHGHAGGFHLQIDSFPPHEPFDPPPGYSEAYDPDYAGDRIVYPAYAPSADNYTAAELGNIRALYAGTITYVDAWLGHFLDQIEALGCMEDTAIVLSSDHGTYTGDHGWTGKLGTYLYDCVSRVPLMIYAPGTSPGTCDALVSNCDVMPTILDVCGVQPPAELHGRSLLALLSDGGRQHRSCTHSGFFGITHVMNDGRYALHLTPDHDAALYWYGVHDSRFASAGDLGPIEVAADGAPRRRVEPRWARQFDFPVALFDLQQTRRRSATSPARAPSSGTGFAMSSSASAVRSARRGSTWRGTSTCSVPYNAQSRVREPARRRQGG